MKQRNAKCTKTTPRHGQGPQHGGGIAVPGPADIKGPHGRGREDQAKTKGEGALGR